MAQTFMQRVQMYLISIVLSAVSLLLHGGEFAIPFIVFPNCSRSDRTSIDSCYVYLLLCPMFVIPVVELVAVVVGFCFSLVGVFVHFAAALLNVGAIVYFVLFFNDRYKNVYKNKAQQVVPPILMGISAIMALILVLDCCRRFIANKLRNKDDGGRYKPLNGGPINADSSDSDSD